MFQQDSESFSASCCPTKKAVAIICLAVFLQTKQKLVWHTDPDVSQNLCKARLQKHSFGHLEICQTSMVKLTWKSVQDSDKNKTMYIDAACVTCTLYCNFFFFCIYSNQSTNLDPQLCAREIFFLYRYFRQENTIYFSFFHSKARFVVLR